MNTATGHRHSRRWAPFMAIFLAAALAACKPPEEENTLVARKMTPEEHAKFDRHIKLMDDETRSRTGMEPEEFNRQRSELYDKLTRDGFLKASPMKNLIRAAGFQCSEIIGIGEQLVPPSDSFTITCRRASFRLGRRASSGGPCGYETAGEERNSSVCVYEVDVARQEVRRSESSRY